MLIVAIFWMETCQLPRNALHRRVTVRGGFPHQPEPSDQRLATSALRGQGPETSVRVASAKTGHGPLPQGITTHRNARSVSRDVDRMRAPTRRR